MEQSYKSPQNKKKPPDEDDDQDKDDNLKDDVENKHLPANKYSVAK